MFFISFFLRYTPSATETCRSCLQGEYQIQNSNTAYSCKQCPNGWHFVSTSNGYTCQTCPKSTYQNENHKNSCKNCPSGWFTSTASNPTCNQMTTHNCPPGEGFTSSSNAGIDTTIGMNVNNDCWRFCGKQDGDCVSYCGTGGKCCKIGLAIASCSGSEGTNGRHGCVAGPSATTTISGGSTANDGTCSSCAVGQYSDASDATGCVSMNLTPCLGESGSGGNSQGEEYESPTSRSDLTGATTNDGTCVGCSIKGLHWYKAEPGFEQCYLYTCTVGGNRCASGASFFFSLFFY